MPKKKIFAFLFGELPTEVKTEGQMATYALEQAGLDPHDLKANIWFIGLSLLVVAVCVLLLYLLSKVPNKCG